MLRVAFVCLAALLAGCAASRAVPDEDGEKPAEPPKQEAPADEGKAPHGGLVTDWSSERTEGKYHVEVCIDRGKREATLYVLGDDAMTPAAIEAKRLVLRMRSPAVEVVLMASPLPDDAKGKSSRFVGSHEKL